MDDKSVQELVREAIELDKNGTTIASEYVEFNQRQDINRTEAYLNSKHISGEVDYMGREKPFFNIVIAARNIWYRATDLDRKNLVIRADASEQEVAAFLATLKLQDWMKREAFGQFLNDWGLSLANHGTSILKFVEQDKQLHCKVMDWNNLIVDPIDFENNIKIERIWMTPAQLRKKKGYNKALVKSLLEQLTTRKTAEGQQKDNKNGYIEVYEVHGELSMAQYKQAKGEKEAGKIEDGDEDKFFQQMHVVAFGGSTDDNDCSSYTLFCGKEAKDPYLKTDLIKKDGQTYAGGAVKNLFEAQWMVNHSEKQIKDHLDLASKAVYQTADGSFVGQNVLTNIENGDILKHEPNMPLTRIQTTPDIVAMQSFKSDWQAIAAQINGISEAMLGQNPPSGSAWRQTQALLQESHSLFELMTENKGLALINMMTEFVIPFIKKQLDNSDDIAAVLEDHQIKQIDSRFLPNEVIRQLNKKKTDTILSGKIYDPTQEGQNVAALQEAIKGNLQGNQRFIKPSDIPKKTWKEVLKDLEWNLDYDVTGEAKDVQGAMATLTTVLQTIATNPGVLNDPNFKMVFNKILGLAGGISPIEISTTQSLPAPSAPAALQTAPQPAAQAVAQPA